MFFSAERLEAVLDGLLDHLRNNAVPTPNVLEVIIVLAEAVARYSWEFDQSLDDVLSVMSNAYKRCEERATPFPHCQDDGYDPNREKQTASWQEGDVARVLDDVFMTHGCREFTIARQDKGMFLCIIRADGKHRHVLLETPEPTIDAIERVLLTAVEELEAEADKQAAKLN